MSIVTSPKQRFNLNLIQNVGSSTLIFSSFGWDNFCKVFSFFNLEVTELNIRMVIHTYIAEIKFASEPKVTYVLAHTQIFPFQMVWFTFTILKWYWIILPLFHLPGWQAILLHAELGKHISWWSFEPFPCIIFCNRSRQALEVMNRTVEQQCT